MFFFLAVSNILYPIRKLYANKKQVQNGHQQPTDVHVVSHPSHPHLSDSWMEKPAFGTALEEHLKRSNREIALPLEACIMMLLETGMKEEVQMQKLDPVVLSCYIRSCSHQALTCVLGDPITRGQL